MVFKLSNISEEEYCEVSTTIENKKSDFFDVIKKYAGEIRFGPAYCTVKVASKGYEIWNGKDSKYGEESFIYNNLSEKYNRLILIKWYSQDPHEQQIVSVDLTTGIETPLVEHQRYYYAGHFQTFDGIFYG